MVRPGSVLIAIALGLWLPGAGASAATREEEELALLFPGAAKVAAATKSVAPEEVSDAAASVAVIGGDEVRAFGYRTLAEVLRTVPECFAGGDRTYPIAGLRGFARSGDYNTRVVLLLDGHAINEPWNNYAPFGTDFPIDLQQVERIEVISGPVSSLYGSSAFFGAVNVVTRVPARRVGGARIAAGSSGYGRAAVSWGSGSAPGAKESPWHVLAYATASDVAGETLHYPELEGSPSGATQRRADADRNASAWVRAARGPFSVTAFAMGRRRGILAGSYDALLNDPRSFLGDARAGAEIALGPLGKGPVSVKLRAYGDAYEYDDLFRYAPDPDFYDLAVSQWAGAEGVLEWKAGPSSFVLSLEDSYSVVRQDSFLRAGRGTDEPDPDDPINVSPMDTRRFNLARGSAHETLRLGTRLKIVAGVYAEKHDFYGLAFAPRGGLLARPWNGATLKLLYGRGFRSPSIYERFFDDGDSQIGNPELRAEAVDSADISFRQKAGQVEIQLGGFAADYRDLIVLTEAIDVPDETQPRRSLFLQYGNGDRVRTAGATAGLAWRGVLGLLRLGATGFAFETGEDRSAILGSPEWIAHVVAILPIERGRAAVSARVAAVGSRPYREGRLPPYAVADVALRVNRLWRNLGVAASATNVLDARYDTPAGDEYIPSRLPEPRRRVFVEARWEW